jgi:hypothetical protein
MADEWTLQEQLVVASFVRIAPEVPKKNTPPSA